MKKVLFILLAAGFTFTSCDSGGSTTTETEVVTDTATVVKEETVEIETKVDTVETETDTLQQQ